MSAPPVNDKLISILSAYFQKHGNPVIPWTGAEFVGAIPTAAYLNGLFDVPANLPDPFFAFVVTGGNRRLVVASGGSWWYSAAMTAAV